MKPEVKLSRFTAIKEEKEEPPKRRRGEKILYECKECPYKVTHKVSFSDHMRRHTGEKLRCNYCSKDFFSIGGLDRHLKHFHPLSKAGGKTRNLPKSCEMPAVGESESKLFEEDDLFENIGRRSSILKTSGSAHAQLSEKKTVTFQRVVYSSDAVKKIDVEMDENRDLSTSSRTKEGEVSVKSHRKGKENQKIVENGKSGRARRRKGRASQLSSMADRRRRRKSQSGGSVKLETENSAGPSANDKKHKSLLVCPTCQFTTRCRHVLASHARVHAKPKFSIPEGMFACKTCNRLYPSQSSLIIHKQKHRWPVVLIKRLPF